MKVVFSAILFVTVGLMAPGCGGSDGGSGPGDGGTDPGTGDGGGDDGDNGDDDNGGGGDGGPSAAGCRVVDLVFSVDPSSSMSEERDEIANVVFPSFAEALIEVGGGLDDYRIGVIDSCPNPATFNTKNSAGEDCNFSSGETWMVSSSPDLVSEFACVGDINADHNCSDEDDEEEQPATSAAASLEGDANPGFLRENALLVVVGITDEDENGPSESAQAIYDRLVAIKGDVKRMVFLGIGGASECEGVYGDAKEARKLKNITDKFIAQDRGVFVDLCEGNLKQGLLDAMAVINQACEQFPDPE